jgi:hypothetical protein
MRIAEIFAGALLVAATPLVAATNTATLGSDPSLGSDPKEDTRIATQLKELAYKYVVTEDKDYRMIIQIADDKRVQTVVANSNTEVYDKAEIREIWSIALKAVSPIDPALAERLLKANNTVKMGAWREWPGDKVGDQQDIYIVFAAQIDANAPQEVLEATLHLVSQTADALEKELAQKDEH